MDFKEEIVKKADIIARAIKNGSDVEIRAQKDGSIKILSVKKKAL